MRLSIFHAGLALITAAACAGPVVHEEQVDAIHAVLARDDALARARNRAPENGTLAAAVRAYVDGLDGLDFSSCPADFTAAYRCHRDAWAASIPFFEGHGDLRGEMHDLFEVLRGRGDAVQAGLEAAEAAIWSTWAEVEASIEAHDAEPVQGG